VRFPAVIVLVAALAWAPAAGAAARCSAPGAKTVVENAQARVFYVKGKGEVKRRFFGCVRGRKPIALARNTAPRDPEQTAFSNKQFHLGGRTVAWVQEASSDFGAGEFGRGIEVRSLAPDRRTVSIDVTDYHAVRALRVRADGAVAWILGTSGQYNEVDALDSDANVPMALAYARGIDPASLRFDAAAVHWSQNGADRSAPVR
jgi:hypothetical protein